MVGHRGNGLTREQLAELLVDKQDKTKPFKTRSALDKHLSGLKQLKNLVVTGGAPAQSKKQTGAKTGHRRDVYTLAESEAITWPETARMMIEIWDSPGHHIPEEVLIHNMLKLGLKRQQSGPVMSRSEIIADIEYSIVKGYTNRYEADIRTDRRLRFEIDYIINISGHSFTDNATSLSETHAPVRKSGHDNVRDRHPRS